MGIYSHYSTEKLTGLRDRLSAALEARLTGPTAASGNGRSVQFQQGTADLERQIGAINTELDRRNGRFAHGPIYLLG